MKIFFVILYLTVCAKKIALTTEQKIQMKEERKQIFREFREHFDKDYLPEEKNYRYPVFSRTLKKLLAKDVMPLQQISFKGVSKGEPVPIVNPRLRSSCQPRVLLFPWADLTDDEFSAKYLLAMPFNHQDVKEGLNFLRKAYPEAKELFHIMQRGRTITPIPTGTTNLGGSKNEQRKMEELINKVFPSYEGPMGSKPPTVEPPCLVTPKIYPIPTSPRRPSEALASKKCSKVSAVKKPSPFTALPQRMLGVRRRSRSSHFVYLDGLRVHRYVNYTPYLNKVMPQGNCLACFAVAISDMVGMSHGVQHNRTLSVSVQELIDCLPGDGCRFGGQPSDVIHYINNYGVASSDLYPFLGYKNVCYMHPQRHRLVIIPLYVFNTVAAVIYALQRGPVVMPFHASNGLTGLYNNEVFNGWDCNPYSQARRHMVLFYGYYSNGDDLYFLVKNSWELDFGKQGHFQLYVPSWTKDTPVPCVLYDSPGYEVKVEVIAT